MKEEVCFRQSFTPSCKSNEVIVVTSATYGRMALGECLQTDSVMGCQADALKVLDRLCSGNQACSVEVGVNPELQDISTCPPDMFAYLDVDYSCLPGMDLANFSPILVALILTSSALCTLRKRNTTCLK